jgi:hypothetical protein
MPRQRSKKLSEGRKTLHQPIKTSNEQKIEDDGHDEGIDNIEKDEDELELDRLVLGDEAGFMAQLEQRDTAHDDEDIEETELPVEEDSEADETNLEGIDDAEVCSII